MSERGEAHATIVPPDYWGAEELPDLAEIPAQTWEAIDRWLAEHPGGRERLIPLLHVVQRRLGWLPFPVLEYVADRLGMSPVEVHGVVSFYHFFRTDKKGRFNIKVCMGTACYVRGAGRVIEAFADELGVEVGDTTEDGLFTLEEVRCVGACGLAPVVVVNDHVYGNVDPRRVRRIVKRHRREAEVETEAAGDGGGTAEGGKG